MQRFPNYKIENKNEIIEKTKEINAAFGALLKLNEFVFHLRPDYAYVELSALRNETNVDLEKIEKDFPDDLLVLVKENKNAILKDCLNNYNLLEHSRLIEYFYGNKSYADLTNFCKSLISKWTFNEIVNFHENMEKAANLNHESFSSFVGELNIVIGTSEYA